MCLSLQPFINTTWVDCTLFEYIWNSLTSGLAVAAGIGGLFGLGEICVKKSLKKRLAKWLTSKLTRDSSDKWPTIVVETFDHIFGKKMHSIRFFGVSMYMSLLFAFVLLLVWSVLYPNQFIYYIEAPWYSPLVWLLLLLSIVNFCPDYLSNCQSRYILGKLAASRGRTIDYVRWLTIDLFLTALLSLFVITVMTFWVESSIGSPEQIDYQISDGDTCILCDLLVLSATTHQFRHDLSLGPVQVAPLGSMSPPYGIFFYTTFLTSIWIWLYSLSGVLVRHLRIPCRLRSLVSSVLDVKEYPIASIGFVAALVVIGIALIFGFVVSYVNFGNMV